MKRFYKLVSTAAEPGGFIIQLDGKPVKTPLRNNLTAPSRKLADLIVQEWAAQGEKIDHETLPLTQILSTKIDRISRERSAMSKAVLKYLDTDMLCYRAEEPPELSHLQSAAWDPWLDWFEKRFGGRLETTTGLTALRQPPELHEKLRAFVKGLDDDRFAAFQIVVPLAGSLVLGCAFVEGAIDDLEIFKAARVEETHKAGIYNEEFYGADPLTEKKEKAVQRDLKAACDYLAAL